MSRAQEYFEKGLSYNEVYEQGKVDRDKELSELPNQYSEKLWNTAYDRGYTQGREDKYQAIVSEYMLLTEEQVKAIRADAIEQYRQALHIQYSQNKAIAIRCAKGNRMKKLALTNLDLEEIDNIAEQLKE